MTQPEPPPGEPAEVRLLLALPDLALDVGTDPRALDLTEYFWANTEAGPLSFSTATIETAGVDVEVSGMTLSVRPTSEGIATVRVEARGELGGVAADTFSIQVADPCPVSVSDGTEVAFPIAVGRRWVYALTTASKPTSQPGARSSGRVEVEVVSAGTCQRDSQGFSIRERRVERFEREVYNPATNSVEWVVDDDSAMSERIYRWTVTDEAVTTDAPDIQGRGSFAPPPFGRRAPRFWDGETYSEGQNSAFGPFVTYMRPVGPTRYSVSPLFGTAGQANETWEYVGE